MEKKKTNQLVDVAPLNAPECYVKRNLLAAIQNSYAQRIQTYTINQWLGKRIVPDRINKSMGTIVRGKIAVFVDLDARDSIDKFLSSIVNAIHCNVEFFEFIFIVNDNELINPEKNIHVSVSNKSDIINQINIMLLDDRFEWAIFIDEHDKFTPQGLFAISLCSIMNHDCLALYGDEIYRSGDGHLATAFRPDFNLDLMLSVPRVMSGHWLFRCSALKELKGFNNQYPSSFEFEYIIRLIETKGMQSIGHMVEPWLIVPAPELKNNEDEINIITRHLHSRGYYDACILCPKDGRYQLRYNHGYNPLVSIIIPTKDQLPMLQRCVTSLLERTSYHNYELIIVDNNSETPETLMWLDGVAMIDPKRIKVLRYPHTFNYSAINNVAAQEARGEYLLLLNNDTVIIQDEWLDNMLNHGLRPEVGIVGAKLLFPDGSIQHAGVILGLRGPAEHIFIGSSMDEPGYMQRLEADQVYSVVTAACLLIRKSIYFEVGGLDEEVFKVSYNDVDLCLKVRNAGYLTLWTPHSVVVHEGSVSQKVDKAVEESKILRFQSEQDAMYVKWLSLIGRDPAYNANLSLNGYNIEIDPDDSELTWRPMQLPMVVGHAVRTDFHEFTRLMTPFRLMKNSAMVDGAISKRFLSIPEISRYKPDCIISNQKLCFSDDFYRWSEKVKRLTDSYMVYDLGGVLSANLDKNDLAKIKKTLNIMDRVIVSSNEQADFITGKKLHPNVVVVPVKLAAEQWRSDFGRGVRGSKPRIGWISDEGLQYKGELEFFHNLLKFFSHEVDWIVMGYCPDCFKPYIREVHNMPESEFYPAKVTTLDLDIALVPLVNDKFNTCSRGNFRVLEHGICGVPVICSNVAFIHENLPITLVANKYGDWVKAINAYLSDPVLAERLGEELKQVVESDWILTRDAISIWKKAWLPN
ncbi:glycosyltransferase [Pectobacterium cacticida]|uniref:glycosyltransferase n=1 Tax=Pectobacterium cacticida TaxID=69221 RepID=UPI002FF178B1